MRWSIVVAAAENDVIGSHGQLPWHLPQDLRRFKALTWGKPVLMGRKTYESIGRPLPGRTNLVLSRQPDHAVPGCTLVSSLQAAAAAAEPAAELMVIGGAQIYQQALPYVTTVYLTRVHARPAGEARFAQLPAADWHELASEYHPADERHCYAVTFVTLQRVLRCSPATIA